MLELGSGVTVTPGFRFDVYFTNGRVQFAPRETPEGAEEAVSDLKTQVYDLLSTTGGVNASTIGVRVRL